MNRRESLCAAPNGPNETTVSDNAEGATPCTCKGWRGLWRTLLWGVPHLFCDRCGLEVRDG